MKFQSVKKVTRVVLAIVGLVSVPLASVNVGGISAATRAHGWTNIGPSAPGVPAPIAVDPAGSGIIYVASVGGGMRKFTPDSATWTTVNSGLQGTAVYALAMDAAGPDTVYAGVFAGAAGTNGVYKTVSGGANWTLLTGVAGIIPTALMADPQLPGVVFMAGLGGNINKSIDGGANWTRSRGNDGFPIYSIVIDPFNSNIMYASSLGGLLKSTNAGTSWQYLSSLQKSLWGIAIDPSNGVLYATTTNSGVCRSSDAGSSWQCTGALDVVPYSIVVDASTDHIFIGSSGGVRESSNSGATWQPTALSDRMAFSIRIGPGGVLYAGTASGPAVSSDVGATWAYPDPTEGGAQAFGYAITVDPNDGSKLFAATLGSSAFISDNQGLSWTRVGTDFAAPESRKINVDPTDSNRVYAGSFSSGIFKSDDGGATWSRRNFGSGKVYVWVPVVNPVHPWVIFAGTMGEGLFKSEDYGESWKQVITIPRTVQGVTVDAGNDQEVFAATTSGVFRSHDGGDTWDAEPALPFPAWSITIVGNDSDSLCAVPGQYVVYATTKTAGVFRSIDGGDTWTAINTGINTKITNLQMGRAAPVIDDPKGSEVLYVGSEGGGGVFRSSDCGDSWSPVNLGLDDTSVFGLAADPKRPGTLYVSGPHGIFATTTGGK